MAFALYGNCAGNSVGNLDDRNSFRLYTMIVFCKPKNHTHRHTCIRDTDRQTDKQTCIHTVMHTPDTEIDKHKLHN